VQDHITETDLAFRDQEEVELVALVEVAEEQDHLQTQATEEKFYQSGVSDWAEE